MKVYLAVALILAIDVLICLVWLGPLWFILIAGVFCGVYVLLSLCQAAGRADERIEAMFDYHVETRRRRARSARQRPEERAEHGLKTSAAAIPGFPQKAAARVKEDHR